MRKWVVLLLTNPILGCALLPVGVGDRMHVCGTVVDENLKPVLDTLRISTRVDHPIMVGMGEALQTESQTTVTNGKFCVDAYNAMHFSSTMWGAGIRALPISALYRSVNLNDFKWVVERNPKAGKRPNFDKRHLLRTGKDKSIGYSMRVETVLYYPDRAQGILVDPAVIRAIAQPAAPAGREFDSAAVAGRWNAIRPNTLTVGRDEDGKTQWALSDPEAITDIRLAESGERIYIISGPLVGTKFMPASLDSPVCNFGRMPGPPPPDDPRWTDTLHVATGDSLLLDGFYVYSPVHRKRGKILLKPEIARDPGGVQLQFAHVIKPLSDTSSFLFWRVEDPGFPDRRKCLTPVEAYRALPEYKGQWDRQ